MNQTVPKDRLAGLTTPELISQYGLAISSHSGRHTNFSPRQKRIDYIVDLIADRADHDDLEAQKWLKEA